jgi:hypothetical protein
MGRSEGRTVEKRPGWQSVDGEALVKFVDCFTPNLCVMVNGYVENDSLLSWFWFDFFCSVLVLICDNLNAVIK